MQATSLEEGELNWTDMVWYKCFLTQAATMQLVKEKNIRGYKLQTDSQCVG